jgi:hypothetical protein
VAAALLALALGLAVWQLHERWRTGHVILTPVDPPLAVQVLDASGARTIVDAFPWSRRRRWRCGRVNTA